MTLIVDMQSLHDDLVLDEGKRTDIYTDGRGNLTGGIGHNFTQPMSEDVIEAIFYCDVTAATNALSRNITWWLDLAENEQRVMVNLCFNMGWPRLAGFTHFLTAMYRIALQRKFSGAVNTPIVKDALREAAADLQDSTWWHEVGERGPRMVARLMGPQAEV